MTGLSPNALTVLKSRYLLKDAQGNITETPEDLFRRVSVNIAKAELLYGGNNQQQFWEEKFLNLISSRVFLPNSPTLMNAGTNQGQLSACYVLPVGSRREDTENTLHNALTIQQSGGGTGFNFSSIPGIAGKDVKEGGDYEGPVFYMEEYNKAMEGIKRTGKRSGANMAILDVSHPDIEYFISSKLHGNTLSSFNISVGISDAFMEALHTNGDWKLSDPVSGSTVKKVEAEELWKRIVDCAWQTGDPGLIFLDSIERYNPTPQLGKLQTTNPCGEVPLLSYEACNLGSINLSCMVKRSGNKIKFDIERLKAIIPIAIRFLDNVIDVNFYSLPEIEKIVKGNRKIGLGVMGWAELLVKLGVRYDSEEAVRFGSKVMCFIQRESRHASASLAREKGAFPNWERSIYYPSKPMRNATVNSIAPTGTISIIADTSSSIEPFFALSFQRKNVLDGVDLYELNPLLKKYLDKYGNDKAWMEKLLKQHGSFEESDQVPRLLKELFKTSLQIPYMYHLKHQAAFQKYTDNAVSKTINLPSDATTDDVDSIYRMAWKMGLKGITIYRYGSKAQQVLYQGTVKDVTYSMEGETCRFCIH